MLERIVMAARQRRGSKHVLFACFPGLCYAGTVNTQHPYACVTRMYVLDKASLYACLNSTLHMHGSVAAGWPPARRGPVSPLRT